MRNKNALPTNESAGMGTLQFEPLEFYFSQSKLMSVSREPNSTFLN